LLVDDGQALLDVALVEDGLHGAAVQIDHHGLGAMALAEGLLVDPQTGGDTPGLAARPRATARVSTRETGAWSPSRPVRP